MKCPNCGIVHNTTERRPNGDTKCFECGFIDKTAAWQLFNEMHPEPQKMELSHFGLCDVNGCNAQVFGTHEGSDFCKEHLALFVEIPDEDDVMSYNVGDSNYSGMAMQPWDVWEAHDLDPWRADIVKRLLRVKGDEDPIVDLQKIQHICAKLISQLECGKDVRRGKA